MDSRVAAPRLGRKCGQTGLAVSAAAVFAALPAFGQTTIYASDFDTLTIGRTQPFPGDRGQDGWFSELAPGAAYGEVQNAVAVSGNALHEFAPASNIKAAQTIDKRRVGSWDISGTSLLTLSFDFYAHSSDLSQVNNFLGNVRATGGPHPGYDPINLYVSSGNGDVKSLDGVDIGLVQYDGFDNNVPITLTVGQDLAWDAWHSVQVVLDHQADAYVSLTVDGATQDLTGYRPERSFYQGAALRGNQIADILSQCVPDNVGGVSTDDDFYVDNLSLTAVGAALIDGTGSSQSDPVLPNSSENGVFSFEDAAGGLWFDPPTNVGFKFRMIGVSLFTQIVTLPNGFDTPFTVSVGDTLLGSFSGGQTVDFTEYFTGGVPSFEITGITPGADDGNPRGFPIQLSFDTRRAGFTMRGLGAAAPEPDTRSLIVVGLTLLIGFFCRMQKPRP